jgi:hypothetical protein
VTVPVEGTPLPSSTVYVNVSVPEKPAFGVYVILLVTTMDPLLGVVDDMIETDPDIPPVTFDKTSMVAYG